MEPHLPGTPVISSGPPATQKYSNPLKSGGISGSSSAPDEFPKIREMTLADLGVVVFSGPPIREMGWGDL